MALSDDLCFSSAVRLLALLHKKEISSSELTRAYLDRKQALNPKLNAFVTHLDERALKEAAEADRRLAKGGELRPLEGLPISIKDSIMMAGVRATDGMKIFADYVPPTDAPTVARLRAAGAIVLGKTNLPEMAMDYDCDNPVFGATRNPWKLDRVPGGSSGGEAAALAAGLAAMGLGSDYGGSIRLPAHFCGIVGLKPSWGTIPLSGHMPPGAASPPPLAAMATIGPMARYVDDLTLSYNIVRGPAVDSVYTVPSPPAEPDKVDLKELRCATFSNAGGVPVRREIAAAVERAAKALDQHVAGVDAATPPIQTAHDIWMRYAMADGGRLLREALGDKLKDSRPRLIETIITPFEEVSAGEFFKIGIERDVFRANLARFMEKYPVIICAPFCITAFEQGGVDADVDGTRYRLFELNWPALWANCAGLPAAVVPAGSDRDGLPIGVQIVGRAFEEQTVLAVAKVLEAELGGFKRPPI